MKQPSPERRVPRILIANRGEIARRVIRTAHRLGYETVAVYADPDADAPFVREAGDSYRLGPAALADSYLSADRLLQAVADTGATAVHPGYGFLSENAAFAQAVLDTGAIWVGPKPEAIASMGSKIEARRLAAKAGVAIIPGHDGSQNDDDLAVAAAGIGYPVLVKASAGGGGKGIRIAHQPDEFPVALNEARDEAMRSFGDDDVIVERYIQRPRHVEVQVLGDHHGTVIELGTRECSVQRRYQKLLEEAPAPNLAPETRAGLHQAAVRLAAAIGYDSTGTVEFIVDDDTGDFYFLEMNTRLQVEHPVTEAVTGLDLVELQLCVAAGTRLPLGQGDVETSGHAIEARVNAEDATADFAPQTGSVSHVSVPDGVRWDSGIEAGSQITPHYDPMVAKLIVHADTRDLALAELRAALDRLLIGGLTTNTGFHRWLLDQQPVVDARVTTRFLDEAELPSETGATEAARVGALAWAATRTAARPPTPWAAATDFRVTPHEPQRSMAMRTLGGVVHEIDLENAATGHVATTPHHVMPSNRQVVVNTGGQSHTFVALSRSERWAPDDRTGHGHAAAVSAPFPAVVADVMVQAGAPVNGGDAIVTIEAMKMLHTLSAAGPGAVDEVRVVPGDQVETHQILVTFVTAEQETQQ